MDCQWKRRICSMHLAFFHFSARCGSATLSCLAFLLSSTCRRAKRVFLVDFLCQNLGPGGQDGSKTWRLWSAWLLSSRCEGPIWDASEGIETGHGRNLSGLEFVKYQRTKISETCKSASHFEKKAMVKAWSNLLPHFSSWFLMMVPGLQILYRSCATDVWQCWPSLALLRLECLHRSELNEPSNQTDLWSKKSQLDQEKWPFFDAVVNAVGTSSKAGDTSSKFCGAQTASRSRFGAAQQGRLQRFKKEKLGIGVL